MVRQILENIVSWVLGVFHEVGPWLVGGAWYEVVLKVSGVMGLLGTVTVFFRYLGSTAFKEGQEWLAKILFVLWLLACGAILALVIAAFIVY